MATLRKEHLKEHVTSVPSKYKFTHGTGRGQPYMYMYYEFPIDAISKYGKYCCMSLYFSGTRSCTLLTSLILSL